MAEGEQRSIRPVEFESGVHPRLPVEVIERSDLIGRLGPRHLASPQRPSFDAFLLVRSGRGIHTVDFVETPLRPGRMVRVRPGQIQVWDIGSDLDATIVLSSVSAQHAPDPDVTSGTYRDLDRGSMETAEGLVDLLRREQARFDGGRPSIDLMNTLYDALSGVFRRGRHVRTTPLPEAYVAFVRAVEKNLGRCRTAREVVSSLNYSERTVTRACQRISGRSARDILNQRQIVEAKRLLAHTDWPASEIAAELGFAEPTNFHKFFVRHAGMRPGEFRKDYRQAL